MEMKELQIPEWVFKKEATCPAASMTHLDAAYPASYCRIEKRLVAARTDPASFHRYCTGDYTACPVWQMKKNMERQERGEKPLPTTYH